MSIYNNKFNRFLINLSSQKREERERILSSSSSGSCSYSSSYSAALQRVTFSPVLKAWAELTANIEHHIEHAFGVRFSPASSLQNFPKFFPLFSAFSGWCYKFSWKIFSKPRNFSRKFVIVESFQQFDFLYQFPLLGIAGEQSSPLLKTENSFPFDKGRKNDISLHCWELNPLSTSWPSPL